MKKLNILTADNKTSKAVHTKPKQQTFSPDLTTTIKLTLKRLTRLAVILSVLAIWIFVAFRLHEGLSEAARGVNPAAFFSRLLLVSSPFAFGGCYTKNLVCRLPYLSVLIFNVLLCCSYAGITSLVTWLLLYFFLIIFVLFVVLIYPKWVISEPWEVWISLSRENLHFHDRHTPTIEFYFVVYTALAFYIALKP